MDSKLGEIVQREDGLRVFKKNWDNEKAETIVNHELRKMECSVINTIHQRAKSHSTDVMNSYKYVHCNKLIIIKRDSIILKLL